MNIDLEENLTPFTPELIPREKIAILIENYNQAQDNLIKMTFAHARLYMADAEVIIFAKNTTARSALHGLVNSIVMPTVCDVIGIAKSVINHIGDNEKEMVKLQLEKIQELDAKVQQVMCEVPVAYETLNFSAIQLSTITLETIRYINKLYITLIKSCNKSA
jgi:hypothetical protein